MTEALPRWCARLVGELEAADAQAVAIARPLDARQLNWSPRPGAWSVGQCLEHLYVTNEVYLGAISNALARRQPRVVEEITPGWFGRWFIRTYMEPSAGPTRVRAPKKIAPAARIGGDILDRFLRSNDNARKVVHGARHYDVNRIRFRNPFIPVIWFTVGTGFQIIATHQRRHLLQAERVRDAMLF